MASVFEPLPAAASSCRRAEAELRRCLLTRDQLDAMLAAADDHHRLLLATAVQTGARKGEVLGLIWADVDVQGRTIRFERQLDRQGNRSELKTKRSRRTVAITPDLAAQLAAHRLAAGARDHELVFVRRDGTPYGHRAADLALKTALRRAGLEHVSWHDLRHAHVSLLFAVGHDPVAIAARIGDSIATVLSIYAHEYDAARRRQDESAALAALYDRGSAMEAPGSNTRQQTQARAPAEVADLQVKRNAAQ
ncbi:MAG: site-specific integrase [Solirubrobacteraceae bacterium]